MNNWEYSGESVDELLEPLIEYAVEKELIADTANSRDLFDTKLMGILTPMPREVNNAFMKLYDKSPEAATDWYYDFSKSLNYVRAGRMAQDLRWKCSSEYGELDITINRSKPEKDPRDIEAAKSAKSSEGKPHYARLRVRVCSEKAARRRSIDLSRS